MFEKLVGCEGFKIITAEFFVLNAIHPLLSQKQAHTVSKLVLKTELHEYIVNLFSVKVKIALKVLKWREEN